MIIGIDGNEANVTSRVGISEFAYELISHFYDMDYDTQFVIYLKKKPLTHMPNIRENWHYRIIKPGKLWTQFGLPLDLYRHSPRPNVFFSPTHYSPRRAPCPTIVSVMDLSYLHFPEYFKKSDRYQLVNWTSYSVKKAVKTITISQSSKDDIIKYYRVKPSQVEVIYPGIKANFEDKTDTTIYKNTMKDKHPYILFVGTLQPRKNINKLIEAFAKVREKKDDLKLLIIGRKGWLYEDILSAPKKYNVESSVEFLDYISDDELPNYYKNAECFVLPSLYEGFGLPVLEAMKYGCPVITSNISSLPEAGGDAALYVNPESVSDIAEKIEKVVKDPNLQESMRKKGLLQIKKFSWEKSAEKTLQIIKEIGDNNYER